MPRVRPFAMERRDDGSLRSATQTPRDLLILVCAASAGIHAALVPEHVREGVGAGAGFAVAAVALAALAVALTRRSSPVIVSVAAVTLAGLIVAYVLAATIGVPVLHPEPEPIDAIALVTKAIEATGLLVAARLLGRGQSISPFRLERNPT